MNVNVNGLNLYVNRFQTHAPGERPVVVLIQGMAVVDNAAAMFVVGFHLARHADVISYDLRGHGRSDRPSTGYAVTDHVDDLLGMLDALGITQPVHTVSFSYGGAIALVAAMRRPERFASICLVDGQVPVPGWEDGVYNQLREYERWQDEAVERGLEGDALDEYVIDRLMDEYGVGRRRATSTANKAMGLFRQTTVRDDLLNEVSYSKEDFGRIDCPVLGVYGDQSVMYWLAAELAEFTRDCTIHTFEGADHLEVYWRLDELRALISRFIGLPD